ncbi:cytosine permease [Virgibacillus sediminis]|uniref:Cytosine permease n=1 Tax=Virgibacillus sediminis TaxID=202260 RepID=A0ABV7A595_9BACI
MGKFKDSSVHDLYNSDLSPVEEDEKEVKPIGYGFVWFGIAIQITCFMSLSPLVSYFTIGQFILVLIIGSTLIGILSLIAQDLGLKYGISFATSVSVAFGYRGGRITNMIRIFPSVIFIGLNAYIGAVALNELFKMVFGFESIILALVINIGILLPVTLNKIKGIEKFMFFIAPILFIVGIYMFYVVLTAYNVSFFDTFSMGNLQNESPSISRWLFSVTVVIGVFSSVALGVNDFTRDCKNVSNNNKWFQSNRGYFIAALMGLVPSLAFLSTLGAITIALSGRTDALVVISELIQERSMILAILLQLFIVLAQVSTNAVANLLPSTYAILSLFPKKLSFKTSIVGLTILGFILVPVGTGGYLDSILSICSATAGPAMAIIGVDYYIIRKRNISLDALYNSRGKYQYFKGVNIVAFSVYIISTLIGFVFFSYLSFYVSTTLAAILYYLGYRMFNKKYPAMLTDENNYTTEASASCSNDVTL